jgi:hypothetical protein
MLHVLIAIFWSACGLVWLLRIRSRANARRKAVREADTAVRKALEHFAEPEPLAAQNQAALDEARAALARAFADKEHHTADATSGQYVN